jgi:hypothetical protein
LTSKRLSRSVSFMCVWVGVWGCVCVSDHKITVGWHLVKTRK